MKIVYVFRDPVRSGYSIEEIFKEIINKLPQSINAESFYYNQNHSLWRNLIRLYSIKTDLYHITGDVNYLAIFLPRKKVILTFHDIGHYKNLKGWKKYVYGLLWVRIPILKSIAATSVSRYTQQDIGRFFPTFANSMHIVANPLPETFKFVPGNFNILEPRILQVGTGAHKNLPTLFTSLYGITCRLVIIGILNEEQISLLAKCKIVYENYSNMTHSQVYEQYVLCDMVTFVTTHEGFGMPILEAQAVGRPIITSNVCSLPEVTNGTAAIVENPMDVTSLRNLILRIIHEPAFRSQLVEAGLENVNRFNSEGIVKRYIQVYKSALP